MKLKESQENLRKKQASGTALTADERLELERLDAKLQAEAAQLALAVKTKSPGLYKDVEQFSHLFKVAAGIGKYGFETTQFGDPIYQSVRQGKSFGEALLRGTGDHVAHATAAVLTPVNAAFGLFSFLYYAARAWGDAKSIRKYAKVHKQFQPGDIRRKGQFQSRDVRPKGQHQSGVRPSLHDRMATPLLKHAAVRVEKKARHEGRRRWSSVVSNATRSAAGGFAVSAVGVKIAVVAGSTISVAAAATFALPVVLAVGGVASLCAGASYAYKWHRYRVSSARKRNLRRTGMAVHTLSGIAREQSVNPAPDRAYDLTKIAFNKALRKSDIDWQHVTFRQIKDELKLILEARDGSYVLSLLDCRGAAEVSSYMTKDQEPGPSDLGRVGLEEAERLRSYATADLLRRDSRFAATALYDELIRGGTSKPSSHFDPGIHTVPDLLFALHVEGIGDPDQRAAAAEKLEQSIDRIRHWADRPAGQAEKEHQKERAAGIELLMSELTFR